MGVISKFSFMSKWINKRKLWKYFRKTSSIENNEFKKENGTKNLNNSIDNLSKLLDEKKTIVFCNETTITKDKTCDINADTSKQVCEKQSNEEISEFSCSQNNSKEKNTSEKCSNQVKISTSLESNNDLLLKEIQRDQSKSENSEFQNKKSISISEEIHFATIKIKGMPFNIPLNEICLDDTLDDELQKNKAEKASKTKTFVIKNPSKRKYVYFPNYHALKETKVSNKYLELDTSFSSKKDLNEKDDIDANPIIRHISVSRSGRYREKQQRRSVLFDNPQLVKPYQLNGLIEEDQNDHQKKSAIVQEIK